jgi:hypothetical protein
LRFVSFFLQFWFLCCTSKSLTSKAFAPDSWVVELVAPASGSAEPYYTAGGEAWVKADGAKQKLKGIALTDFTKQRLTKTPQ